MLPADPLQIMKVTEPLREGQKMVEVTGQVFPRAVEFVVEKLPPNPWDAQPSFTLQGAIKKGDVLHVRLYARCARSMTGSATLEVICERNHEPFNKTLIFQYSVGNEWTELNMPFVAKNDYSAGEAQLCIRLGFVQQSIQIGGLQILNYGPEFDKSKLPATHLTYDGREADAPWRKLAAERIDQLRKANLKITVVDGASRPLPNAQVHVAMQRHEFLWGTCVATGPMLGNTPDDLKYRETLKQYFNHAVIENALKWVGIARNGYAAPDQMVAWLQENNISVRGHNLIWPGKQFLPKSALDLLDKPEALRQLCDTHITETASRYSGKLADWDVLNEPFTNHLLQDKLGEGEMAHWFKLAKAADPKARLYINDYAILASGNLLASVHQNHYYDTIKSLLAQGAPVEGIGMQGHFGSHVTSPENLLKILDRFAAFGLPIKVTELDIQTDDDALRSDYMRDLNTILFSHPSVVGVLQWGFWEKAHWLPDAALFDKNWKIRPHGQAWIDLVHKQWKTDVTQVTDASGSLSVRGFKGDYLVTVTTANGRTTTQALKLTGAGTDVIISVK